MCVFLGAALTSSTLWRQIIADTLGKDLYMEHGNVEATSKGVAYVIGKALNKFEPINEQLGLCSVTKSNHDAKKVYDEARKMQEHVYDQLFNPSFSQN